MFKLEVSFVLKIFENTPRECVPQISKIRISRFRFEDQSHRNLWKPQQMKFDNTNFEIVKLNQN